ncbi:MAG: hypothetical protein FWD35_01950 [Oscillospiraceae bacterium]|nr:hypothetical protein [Oscillospiraceae bacterium]
MALETKVILNAAVQTVKKAKSLKEAYVGLVEIASVEGLQYPSYEEAIAELKLLRGED